MYTHVHAEESFMVYFKQDQEISDMGKSYSFPLVIISANNVVTMFECFINKGSQLVFSVLYTAISISIVRKKI